MKLPKKIDVKGATYQVIEAPQSKIGEGILGLCDSTNHKIYIASELGGFRKDAIFFHELIHAICEEVGLTQAHVSDDVFEILSESISTFLVDRFTMKLKGKNMKPSKKGDKKSGKKGGGKKGC